MAKQVPPLTDAHIRDAKVPEDAVTEGGKPVKQIELIDGMVTGLRLLVTRGKVIPAEDPKAKPKRGVGKKIWTYRYKPKGTKKWKRIKIGNYPAFSLDAAREEARKKMFAAQKGEDLRPKPQGPVRTVGDVVADRMKYVVAAQKTAHDTELRYKRMFENDATFKGGLMGLPIKEFGVGHYNKILDAVMDRGKKGEAIKVHKALITFAKYAKKRREVDVNPLTDLDVPATLKPRSNFLTTPDEINVVWYESPENCHLRALIRFLLATAQRGGETTKLLVENFNVRERTVLYKDTKNGLDLLLPLNDLAFEILMEQKRKTNTPFLFPAPTCNDPDKAKHVMRNTVASALRDWLEIEKRVKKFTPHDLRRTVSTLGSRNKKLIPAVDKWLDWVMNHVTVTKGTVRRKHYDPYEYLDEKVECMDEWGWFLAKMIGRDDLVKKIEARWAETKLAAE